MFSIRKLFSKKHPWIYYTSEGGMGVDINHPVYEKRILDTVNQFMEMKNFNCQSEIEENSKCVIQCNHCYKYYNLKQLKEAYQLTGNPMVGKKEYYLNLILNEALIGKNRIKGIPNSNKIAEFVNKYLTRLNNN
jgi:hypothetical protein